MSAASGRSRSSSTTSRQRCDPRDRGRPGVGSGTSGDLSEHEHPTALALHDPRRLRAPDRQQHVGAPSTNHSPPSSRRAALHFQRDENGTSALGFHACAVARRRRSPRQSDCGPRRSPRSRPGECVTRPASSPVAAITECSASAAIGERAGLVEAHRVDVGQRLDRVQILHQHSLAGEAHRGDGERHAGQQDQPLRNEGHDAGRRQSPAASRNGR